MRSYYNFSSHSHLSPVMHGVADFGLHPGLPGRVDHLTRLQAQLRTGQRELDLRRRHLHRQLPVLLQPLPHLVPVPPQGLESIYGGDSLVRQLVI